MCMDVDTNRHHPPLPNQPPAPTVPEYTTKPHNPLTLYTLFTGASARFSHSYSYINCSTYTAVVQLHVLHAERCRPRNGHKVRTRSERIGVRPVEGFGKRTAANVKTAVVMIQQQQKRYQIVWFLSKYSYYYNRSKVKNRHYCKTERKRNVVQRND